MQALELLVVTYEKGSLLSWRSFTHKKNPLDAEFKKSLSRITSKYIKVSSS